MTYFAPVRALIADDEPLLRAELREALAQAWPALQVVAEASDGRAAVSQALALRPEVLFLDVSMPHLDGMAAATQLRASGYAGEIVFVTAYDQHALRAFEQRALDYLVKPLEPERLGETIARLQARLGGTPRAVAAAPVAPPPAPAPAPDPTLPWLRVTRGNQTRLVAIDDVACFRAVPGYTQILTAEAEHLIEEPLKNLADRLDPRRFVQVHRAAIVNLHFIDHIERDRPGHCVVMLKHGLGRVEVSRAGAELLKSL